MVALLVGHDFDFPNEISVDVVTNVELLKKEGFRWLIHAIQPSVGSVVDLDMLNLNSDLGLW